MIVDSDGGRPAKKKLIGSGGAPNQILGEVQKIEKANFAGGV